MIERGEGSSPTVPVHGGISEAGEFCLLANHISGHVLIPDRPGYGLSYPIDYRMSTDGIQLVARSGGCIGEEQINVVANSMGGLCAMAFDIALPKRIGRLVLAGAPAGLDKWIPHVFRVWGNRVMGQLISRMPIKAREILRNRRRVVGIWLPGCRRQLWRFFQIRTTFHTLNLPMRLPPPAS